MSSRSEKLAWLESYANVLFGIPYIWGGNNPLAGFDCSGLVCELLRSVGIVKADQSAQSLYDILKKEGTKDEYGLGAVAFFGKSEKKITHVGLLLTDTLMIEAGGGNASVTTKDQAARANAFVRLRPLSSREDLVSVIMPDYGGE